MSGDYFELRLYRTTPGRVGDLHHRMGFEIPPLFARHGVGRPIACWHGFAGAYSPLFCYMLRWRSLDERFCAFGHFYNDPEWVAQATASNAGEQMLERLDLMILRESPGWPAGADTGPDRPVGGLHELRFQRLNARHPVEAHRALGETDLPFLRQHGATILGVLDVWYGAAMPQAVILLAWDDFASREAGLSAHARDSATIARRRAERERFGGSLLGDIATTLIRPANYSTARANLAPQPAAAAHLTSGLVA